MDSKELHHNKELLQRYKQRLYGLELKEAWQGINTPVEILIEMENLRGKIQLCQAQIDEFQKIEQTSARLDSLQTDGISDTDRKLIEITFNGMLDDVTPEIQKAIIRAIAGIVEVSPDQVTLLNVRAGSVIFAIELPARAADTILKLYESGDEIIKELEIEKVTLASEKELALHKSVENVAVNENALRQLTVDDLARKNAQETDLYFAHHDFDSRYGFELFRRAIKDKDERALEALMVQYQPLVARWVDRWMTRHPDYSLFDEETGDYVAKAFERFWRSFTPAKLEKTRSLAEMLRFLQMCVNGAITDAWRNLRHNQLELEFAYEELAYSAPEPTPEDLLQTNEFWELIRKKVKDPKEYTVMYATFSQSLSPREILAEYPGMFSDVKEIYQHKANLLNRLERSEENEDREIRTYINKKDVSNR